jgi:FKBP12-rapamycin complex-associated protein
MLKVLHTDTSQRRQATRKVLHALEVFETNLEDYLHLVIPAIVNLFEQEDPEMDIHKLAIQTLGRLCTPLDFTDYASRIIHPIVRLLDSPVEKTKDQTKVAALNDLRKEAFETLSALVYQLKTDYAIFIPMVNKVMIKQGKVI